MNIVTGYLNTPEGRAALDRAVEEATVRGATLVVVHTDQGDEAADLIDEREDLDRVRERLAATGVEHTVRALVRGNTPGQDLVAVAQEMDAELIVIGIRRRSPVGKVLLGSNAQDVLLNAPCPVLCVRPEG